MSDAAACNHREPNDREVEQCAIEAHLELSHQAWVQEKVGLVAFDPRIDAAKTYLYCASKAEQRKDFKQRAHWLQKAEESLEGVK